MSDDFVRRGLKNGRFLKTPLVDYGSPEMRAIYKRLGIDYHSDDDAASEATTVAPKAGGKRKRDGLPDGISMNRKQFQIVTRDVVTSKKTSCYFKTLAEAEAAYAAERALHDEHKRQNAAQPQAEKRADNLATYGNNCKLEREFAMQLHAADPKIETMNDGVLADSCGFFYDDEPQLALGIQLKVAQKPTKFRDNAWVFSKVNHYPCMPVVCFRKDTQDGWIYDGTDLAKRKSGGLGVAPGGINAKLSINTDDERTRATPLPVDGLIARLRELAADRVRFPPHTKAFLSWQFGGKAHDQLKERIGLHLEELRDKGSTFPEAQNGSYDQIGSDGRTRRQLKTGRVQAGKNGWLVGLEEHAGNVDGKKTTRPYAAGVFDEVVVYVFDWPTRTARVWRIPESKLVEKGYMRTDTQTGKKGLYVHEFAERQSNLGPAPDTWTAAYFEGTVPIILPPEAREAAGHLLKDLFPGANP
jgi:hypothetical protein